MRGLLLAAMLAAISARALAGDVGVSVSVGQPGFYGRIDINGAPPPQLIYSQPIVIEPVPATVATQPIYLYVPARQARDWRRYCRRYDACGQPVYFVRQAWYEGEYVPYYRHEHRQYQVLYAHDIHSDVVRASVIRAHDVHAEVLRARVVYRSEGEYDAPHGGDIHAPMVQAGEIDAHDIHARVIEVDTLYVHDLHADQ